VFFVPRSLMEKHLLPILLQPIIHFPGTVLPVAIWTPAQRDVIRFGTANGKRIGLIGLPMKPHSIPIPREGSVGCYARIRQVRKLPKGAYRIVLRCEGRFSVTRLALVNDSFLAASVEDYEDMPESPALLNTFADEVRLYYGRFQKASTAIANASQNKLPQLNDDPAALSFQIAALLKMEDESCQRFLASRSALMRLRELSAILSPAAAEAESRAETSAHSRTNGNGAKKH